MLHSEGVSGRAVWHDPKLSSAMYVSSSLSFALSSPFILSTCTFVISELLHDGHTVFSSKITILDYNLRFKSRQ